MNDGALEVPEGVLEACARRRLRVVLLRRQFVAARGSARAAQALAVAVGNERARAERLVRSVAASARRGLDAFEAKQEQWDASIYGELRAMSREQGVPVHADASSSSPPPQQQQPPTPSRPAPGAQQKFLYDSEDLLQALSGVSAELVAAQADGPPPARRTYGRLCLGLAVLSKAELRALFPELAPSVRQVGVDEADLVFAREHEQLGLRLAKLGSVELVERYLRQGCSPALRPRLYKLVLHDSSRVARGHLLGPPGAPERDKDKDKDKDSEEPGRTVRAGRPKSAAAARGAEPRVAPPPPPELDAPESDASGSGAGDDEPGSAADEAAAARLLGLAGDGPPRAAADATVVDRLHKLDLELIRNNEHFFVFEDLLRNVLPTLFREHLAWLHVHSRVVPRRGHIKAVPFYGLALQAAPLAYIFRSEEDIVLALREMLARYWCQLNALRNAPPGSGLTTLPNLCEQFEVLLAHDCPDVVRHMLALGLAPVDVALPWVHLAFANALTVESLLLLWDRIIGFDSLLLLPALAASIFKYRARALLGAGSKEELRELLRHTAQLNPVALLQAFLFT
jgi:hypothetical protein